MNQWDLVIKVKDIYSGHNYLQVKVFTFCTPRMLHGEWVLVLIMVRVGVGFGPGLKTGK